MTRGAIKLFRVFGISIYIHFSFLVLPALFFYTGGLRAMFLILLIFACVTLHELAHSLTARRFGVITRGITLYPIGGVASMGSLPEKPRQELLISLVGPAFNIMFAAVLFYPLYAILGREALFNPSTENWPRTIAYAFWMNPALAVFNLLPAFPMDGGRILRAFLAQRVGLLKATRIATWIGHALAVIFGAAGLIYGHVMWVIIAVFIYTAASNEAFGVELKEAVKELKMWNITEEKDE